MIVDPPYRVIDRPFDRVRPRLVVDHIDRFGRRDVAGKIRGALEFVDFRY